MEAFYPNLFVMIGRLRDDSELGASDYATSRGLIN